MTSITATRASGTRITPDPAPCTFKILLTTQMMDARYISAKVVQEVIINQKHLDQALREQLKTVTDPRDISLARELSYGVLRWYPRLTFIANTLLKSPIRAKDTDILALICSGLYQLSYLRIPDHAAISATVETARALGKTWACVLINAILRRYQREKESIEKTITRSETALYSHPQWIITRLRETWPEHWQQILTANNEHAPMHLRVNLQKHSRTDYLQILEQAGIDATPCSFASAGISLSKPLNVEDIPGFQLGDVSVQDFGAQLAAGLLGAAAGHRVLDACAAPGGKTGHILELTPNLQQLVSIESDPARITLLRDNINRLGLNVCVVQADVRNVSSWWDGLTFDRIFLDAPCSATGVIRRHPDIKLLRTPEHIRLFSLTQSELLESVWPLLKPGGALLYSTCSILNEESDDQIASFANKYDDTRIIPIDAPWGIASPNGRYILPGPEQTDGFYYALMTKISGQ